MLEETLYAERMPRAGAAGYINQQESPEELVKAIRRGLDNYLYLSPATSERLWQRVSGKSQANQSPLERLTDRELEIFELLGQGKTPREIAPQLHLSAKTIAVPGANIRPKLNLKSTAHLIRFAVRAEPQAFRLAESAICQSVLFYSVLALSGMSARLRVGNPLGRVRNYS